MHTTSSRNSVAASSTTDEQPSVRLTPSVDVFTPPQHGATLKSRQSSSHRPSAPSPFSGGFPLHYPPSAIDTFVSVPESVSSDPTAIAPSHQIPAVIHFVRQKPADIPESPAVDMRSIHIPSPTLQHRRSSSNSSSSYANSPFMQHRQLSTSTSSVITPTTGDDMTPTLSYATHMSALRPAASPTINGIDPLMEWHGGTLDHWFELEGLIGRGAFCDVHRAVRRDSGTAYAVKIFRTVYYNEVTDAAGNDAPTTGGASMAAIVQHEMQVLKQCRHENIVSYYGCLPSATGQLCLVMDLCEGGSVKELLQNAKEPVLERHIAYIVRCVLLALEYLHNPERQVVHRDIKAANILLNAEGRVRLADFGISAHTRPFAQSANHRFDQDGAALKARKYRRKPSITAQSSSDGSVGSTSDDSDFDSQRDDEMNVSNSSSDSSSAVNPTSNLIGGSPLWMAPESLRGATASSAGDVWSLGITVLELSHGVPPHSTIDNFADAMARICLQPAPTFDSSSPPRVAGKRSPARRRIASPVLTDFIQRCLQKRPEDRATVEELLQHHFITGTLQSVCSNGSMPLTSAGCTFLGPAAEYSTKPDQDFAHFLQHRQYDRLIPPTPKRAGRSTLSTNDRFAPGPLPSPVVSSSPFQRPTTLLAISGFGKRPIQECSTAPVNRQNPFNALDDTGKHLRKRPHLMDRRFSQPQSSPPIRRVISATHLAMINAKRRPATALGAPTGSSSDETEFTVALRPRVVLTMPTTDSDSDLEADLTRRRVNFRDTADDLLNTPRVVDGTQLQPPFSLKRALSIHIPDDEAVVNKSFLISADGTWMSGGFAVSVDGNVMNSPPNTGMVTSTELDMCSNDNLTSSESTFTKEQDAEVAAIFGQSKRRTHSTDSVSSLDSTTITTPSLQLAVSSTSPSNVSNSISRGVATGIKMTATDLVVCGQVGRGQNGPVFKALHLPSLTRVALKHMNVHDRSTRHQLVKELAAFSKFNSQSPYLSSFLGAFHENGDIALAGYYMDGGSLQSFVKRHAKTLHRRRTESISLEMGEAADLHQLARQQQHELDMQASMPPRLVHSSSVATNQPSRRCNVHQPPKGLVEPVLAAIAKQVVLGLEFLHNNHQLHRDIKPDNILIDHDLRVRINDFGLCTELQNTLAVTETFLGTLSYMAPERVASREYSYPSDIWSLGMLMIYCATSTLPRASSGGNDYWSMLTQAMQLDINQHNSSAAVESQQRNLSQGGADNCASGVPVPAAASASASLASSLSPCYHSKELRSFVTACLQVDLGQRPSAAELLAHPFIAEVSVDTDSLRNLTNKQFWCEELEVNIKDLRAMLTAASARKKLDGQHLTIGDTETAMLAHQFGLDIYTIRQIAQASDVKLT